MTRWAVLMILLLCITAISCSSGVQEGSEKRASVSEKEKDVKDYMIKILPESPTVADSIVAEVKIGDKGRLSSKLNFVWEKNNQEIKEFNSQRIDGGGLKRGDVIRVKIMPQGGEAKGEVFYSEPAVIQNALPIVKSIKIKPDKKDVSKKDTVTAIVEAKDADGDAVSLKYQWIKNGVAEIEGANSNSLLLVNYKRGDFVNLKVTANDGIVDGEPVTSGPVTVINTPPQFTSQPPAEVSGYEYSYKASAVDADNDALKYSLSKAPAGMSISPSGELKWNITEKDEGRHDVEIAVEDGNGGRTVQGYLLTIKLPR
ncbi:MAG: putative Ig domain-containing protein [Nitrospirota bacterium]